MIRRSLRALYLPLMGLSVAGAITTLILWNRSYNVRWQWTNSTPVRTFDLRVWKKVRSDKYIYGLILDRGTFGLSRNLKTLDHPLDYPWNDERSFALAGFRCGTVGFKRGSYRFTYYAIAPFWFPLVVFSILPTSILIRSPLQRRSRRKRNQCIKCGYSLVGNVSGVCPECGEKI